LTMERRRFAFDTPSMGSMKSRVHGMCSEPEGSDVSVNARLYEPSNIKELQID
jgi:hypothetical protein